MSLIERGIDIVGIVITFIVNSKPIIELINTKDLIELWHVIKGFALTDYAHYYAIAIGITMLAGLCFFIYKKMWDQCCKLIVIAVIIVMMSCSVIYNNEDDYMAKAERQELNKNTRAKLMKRRYGRNLHPPGFTVFPEALMIEYYHKGAAEPKLNPTRGYNRRMPLQKGTTIAIQDIFSEIKGRTVTYVAVVGEPGDGKTETAKNFALDVLDRKIPSLKEVEVVQYIDITDLKEDNDGKKLYTTGELLCMGLQSKHHCIKWVIKNPHKFMLIVDGIDKIGGNLGQKLTRIDSNESATKILNNLFSSRVCQGIKILITSRRYGIRDFEPEIRPERIIALNGLEMNSIEKLVKAFGENEGENIWKKLESKYKPLLRLCQSPLFLTYTVSILKENEEASPKTMTQILLRTIYDFTSSSFISWERNWNILDTLHELKSIAFDATNVGTRIFTRNQLPKNLEAIKNLFTVTLRRGCQGDYLEEGHYVYSFIHETLQETLAALYVAEMPAKEFESFLSRTFLNPEWGFVHKVMIGVILNDETRELAKDSLLRENRDIQKLKQHLYEELVNTVIGWNIGTLVESRLTEISDKWKWNKVMHEFNLMKAQAVDTIVDIATNQTKLKLASNSIMEIFLKSKMQQNLAVLKLFESKNQLLLELINDFDDSEHFDDFPESPDVEAHDLLLIWLRLLNNLIVVHCNKNLPQNPSDVKTRQHECREIVREIEEALKQGLHVIKIIYGEKLFETLREAFYNIFGFWLRPEIRKIMESIKLKEVTDPKKWEEIVRRAEVVIEQDLSLFESICEYTDSLYDDVNNYHYEILPKIYSFIRGDAFKKADFLTVVGHFFKYVDIGRSGVLIFVSFL